MGVALSEAARASFGEEPSAGTFATMVPFIPATMVPTPGFPTHISSMPPPFATGPGMTQLTSSSAAGPLGAPGSRRRKRAMVLGGVGLLGTVMGMAVLLARVSGGAESGSTIGSAAAGSGGVSKSAVGSPSPREPDLPRPSYEPFGSASAPTTEVDVSSLPLAPLTTPATPAQPSQPSVPSTPRGSSGSRPAAPARAVPSKPTKPSTFLPPSGPGTSTPPSSAADPCNPPYRLDFFGNKVAKPGCSL